MRWTIVMVSLVLAACGSQEAAVSEEAAGPPAPQRLLYQDIEENELFGASCTFAPTGGGEGGIAIAMLEQGIFKLEGEVVKLAAMVEGQELGPPEMKYSGDEYAFTLSLDSASERPHGEGGREYDASLTINARDGSIIYGEDGLAQCAG